MIPLLLIPLTMLVSALHGHNSLSKGWLIAAHVITVCTISLLAGLPFLYALAGGVVLPLFFWGLMRRGWAAREELDEMDTINHPKHPMWKVAVAHFPHLFITFTILVYGAYMGHWQAWVGIVASLLAYPLPIFALWKWNYSKVTLGQLDAMKTRFWDTRRKIEVWGVGASAGIQHAAFLATAGVIF